LLSYIQGIVDEQQKEGMFVITGSQQFELMDSITQSLAGRTALVKLLLLKPHHKNFRKRFIKSPKLYFIDVGPAACLLDIQDETHVKNHSLRGYLFETFAIAEN